MASLLDIFYLAVSVTNLLFLCALGLASWLQRRHPRWMGFPVDQ